MIEVNPLIMVQPPIVASEVERPSSEKLLSELSAEDLSPGNRISTFRNFDDLEAFVVRTAVLLGDANTSQDSPNAFYFRRERAESVQEGLLDQVRRRHFNGRLMNFSVLMLLPNMIPNVPQVRRSIQENGSFAFLVDAEMHSTGRGQISNARRVCGVYLSPSERMDFFLSNNPHLYVAREILVTSRPFDSASFHRDLDNLLASSKIGRDAYLARALSRIVSGGLPSLGRR